MQFLKKGRVLSVPFQKKRYFNRRSIEKGFKLAVLKVVKLDDSKATLAHPNHSLPLLFS